MFKFLAFVGILGFVYFLAVGFLHTSNRYGWGEQIETKPAKTTRR
jgi:hypothetical protein